MIRPGSSLGPYTVTAPIGKGGMGEVYRATDTRLGRDVALKVLSGDVAADAERIARFEREARAASLLNHPAIVTIFDVGAADGTSYIAMELVNGRPLRAEMRGRPLAMKRLLHLSAQIAEGLARAHQAGIVHRDLKPENIMLTDDGNPKIVDFGLAKLMPRRDESPATTQVTTADGAILGTVAYMSPEQASGQPVDFRTDQFAFGTIVYELATGRHPFAKASSPQTLAAIIGEDPVPAARLNAALIEPLTWVVDRCLEKDPNARYASTDDLARDLARLRHRGIDDFGARSTHQPRRWLAAAVIAAAVTTMAVMGISSWRDRPAPDQARAIRLTIPMSSGIRLSTDGTPPLALSSDSRHVAYVASSGTGRSLFLRAIDQFHSTEMADTAGASMPFFSPDGQWIAFFSGGKLKKIRRDGGAAVVLADAPIGRGGDWGSDNTIVFSPSVQEGLWTISGDGGTATRLTSVGGTPNELSHRAPQFLPGGRAILFTIDRYVSADMAVVDRSTGETTLLIRNAAGGRYVAPGFVLFAWNAVAHVQRFEPDTLTLTGSPTPVGDDLGPSSVTGLWNLTTSADGSLAFVPRGGDARRRRTLVWVTPDGKASTVAAPPAEYEHVRLSPDSKRIAVGFRDHSGSKVTIIDTELGRSTELPNAIGAEYPVWSPDGKRIAFFSESLDRSAVHVVSADGAGPVEQLFKSPLYMVPLAWSPTGEWLSVMTNDLSKEPFNHLWAYRVDQSMAPFKNTSFPGEQSAARISPDGKWLAYVSSEGSGINVFVSSFPVSGARHQITSGGAGQPNWSVDGRELYYREGNRLMAVPVRLGEQFQAGAPRMLFAISDYLAATVGQQGYDVAPDGRFLMIRTLDEDVERNQINVVVGWGRTLAAAVR